MIEKLRAMIESAIEEPQTKPKTKPKLRTRQAEPPQKANAKFSNFNDTCDKDVVDRQAGL